MNFDEKLKDIMYDDDGKYPAQSTINQIKQLISEIIGEDEWEDPDIKGNPSHSVEGPHERNLFRAELRKKLE